MEYIRLQVFHLWGVQSARLRVGYIVTGVMIQLHANLHYIRVYRVLRLYGQYNLTLSSIYRLECLNNTGMYLTQY